MTVLGPDILNSIWIKWYRTAYKIQRISVIDNDYSHVPRAAHHAQIFEKWLWKQGAEIRRKNKKCYLHFFDEQNATFFMLKWL